MSETATGGQGAGRRSRWQHVEEQRDREVLVWIGRFRFVTVDVLARRFGVSEQRTRARVRRLETEGLVHRPRRHVSDSAVIYLTPAGARAIGSRRHRAPRVDTHRAHEYALTQLVCQLELTAGPGLLVLTERDARDREATGPRRFSVDVSDGRGGTAKRWPDVILVEDGRTVALEVEFAEKGSTRLRQMLDAYLASSMEEVRFLVSSHTLAARLSKLAGQQSQGMLAFSPTLCAITVAPWIGVSEEDAEKIRQRLA